MVSAWMGIIFVLAILLGLMPALRWYEGKSHPHPEVLRKLLHVIMGSVSISFPWLFHEVWPIWVLAVSSATFLALVKRWLPLRSRFASIVCSIKRKTYGEFCFPLAVAMLFTVAHAQPIFYCISLSILALGDALAALIGIFYGKHKYTTSDGLKTIEGSFCFFVVSAFATYGGLVLSGTNFAPALAIACLLGCLVTAFEAIAWQGLDNLFIPLSAFALLKTLANEPLDILAQQLAIAVLLLTASMFWRVRTTLDDGAALGAGLFCYVSWAVGGFPWLLPPLTAFVLHSLLMPRKFRRNMLHTHSIHQVVWVASVGFLWLFMAKMLDAPLLLIPYTLSYAIHTSLIGCAHVCRTQRSGRYNNKVMVYVPMVTCTCFFLPVLVLNGLGQATLTGTLLAAPFVYTGTLAFCLWYRRTGETFSATSRWAMQTCVVALSSAVGLVSILIY